LILQVFFTSSEATVVITTGVVPQSMKYARVKPLFKKNNPLEVGNYRPISILSIVYTILERSVYKQLVECLQENKMSYHLLPWGTPHDTFIGSEIVLFTDTNWTLSVRYDSNQSTDCTHMTFSLLHKIL
jgi:hypothetical protein